MALSYDFVVDSAIDVLLKKVVKYSVNFVGVMIILFAVVIHIVSKLVSKFI